jgi:hypothetical protein
MLCYLPVWIAVNATIEPMRVFDTIMTTTSALYFMTATIYLFIEKIRRPGTIPGMPWSRFWAASGIFVYFLGNCTLFVLAPEIAKLVKLEAMSFMLIRWVVSSASNILFALALGVKEQC